MPTYKSRRSGIDLRTVFPPLYKPSECPTCEYDRQFPFFEAGGWLQQDNNGPIVPCPMCNDDGSFPREPHP